jgi:hypothetical protein
MIDLDDDLDELLFDEPDQDAATAERTNTLVIPARPSAEVLNQLERAYRSQGLPACVFIEDSEETGQPFLGNAVALGKLMGLPADILPTEEQYDDWAARRNWAAWEW